MIKIFGWSIETHSLIILIVFFTCLLFYMNIVIFSVKIATVTRALDI